MARRDRPQLRERKKERTRAAIVEAAWRLFREKGYEATTIDEIADAALVAPRTFFRYFPAKEAVVFHRSAERLALLHSLLAEGGKGFDAVTRACLGIARHYARDREQVIEQYRIVESSPTLRMTEGEIDRRWVAALAAALATPAKPSGRAVQHAHPASRGARAAEREARILAGAVFGAMRATLAEWIAGGGRADLVRLGTQALSIFDRGRA